MSAKGLLVRLMPVLLVVGAVVGAAAAQPNQTASDFYMNYRAAFAKAKSIDEVMPFMSKEVRAKVESTPAAERPKMFEFIKEMSSSMTNVKVMKETKTDNGVMLTVEGLDGKEKMTGQVQIVREDGGWKVGRESWSNK